jgi:hypothetical protein
MLKHLGGRREDCKKAMERAADWALSCRNADGGFGHFPGSPSDWDAVYFHVGTLVMAGRLQPAAKLPKDAHLLGWGHLFTAAHTLRVDGRGVTWNGGGFVLPCSKREISRVLGEPDRTSPGVSDIMVWDTLGIYAYTKRDSETAFALGVALAEMPKNFKFGPKVPFEGGLVVGDSRVSSDSKIDQINKEAKGVKFQQGAAPWRWWAEADGYLYFLSRGTPEQADELGPIQYFVIEAVERKK